MSDLDLEAIKARYAKWEAAQEACYGLPASTASRRAAECAMDCGHDVPALVAEVEQLRAALLEEQTVHAKTFDNFEAFAETSLEQQQGLQAALARVEREYRRCIVAARVTHDSVHYATCNGRAEAYRQLADEVAAAAGLQAPDWDRIRREVPSDGIYRGEVINGGG